MPSLSPYQLSVAQTFLAAGIEFLVIGGKAMQAHGMNRETEDLDLVVSRAEVNADKLHQVLSAFTPVQSNKLTVETLQMTKKLLCLPDQASKEVDVLTSVGALDFAAATQNALLASFENLELRVLGLEELLYTKVVSASSNLAQEAQARDLADVEAILAHWKRRLSPSIERTSPGRSGAASHLKR